MVLLLADLSVSLSFRFCSSLSEETRLVMIHASDHLLVNLLQ
jgi:hypothetical protein